MIELSIIIPTYNEIKRLPKTLNEYILFFNKKKIEYEIIITDFSNDGSKQLIKEYMKKHKNIKLINITQRGKGLAVYEGFRQARGRILSFTDADNSVTPEEFYKLYKEIRNYDAVIGSRGLKESKVTNYHQDKFRRIGSYILTNIFIHKIFGLKINDTQCGAKIFKRDKIMKILPQLRIMNSIFDIELLWRYSKLGTIKEIPIKWIDDKATHFKWTETIPEFYWLLRVRLGI